MLIFDVAWAFAIFSFLLRVEMIQEVHCIIACDRNVFELNI